MSAQMTSGLTLRHVREWLERQDAVKRNPKGVRTLGQNLGKFSAEMAGYLALPTTQDLRELLTNSILRRDYLEPWKKARNGEPGHPDCNGRVDVRSLWKLISRDMSLSLEVLMLPLSSTEFQYFESSERAHVFWIVVMHKIIEAFPHHFLSPPEPGYLGGHAPENWYRALQLLRCFWNWTKGSHGHRAPSKPAITPVFLTDEDYRGVETEED